MRVDARRKDGSNGRYGCYQQACTCSEPVTGCSYLGKLTIQLGVQAVIVTDRHSPTPPYTRTV